MNTLFEWKKYQEEIDKKIKNISDNLERNFRNIYVSRVNIGIFSDMKVFAYDTECKLSEIANISLPSARLLNIKPYNPGLLETIEKAIRKYKNELNPVITEDNIKISFPAPTEESRKKAVKEAKEYLEQSKISVRILRKDIQQALKEEKLPEDQDQKYKKLLDQEIVKKINERLDELFSKKEKELMTI